MQHNETKYRVCWEIDIVASSPEDAARRALRIQRDPASTATVFDVHTDLASESVDLLEIDS